MYADPTRLRSRRGNRWSLTGLLFCGICGGRLTGRPSGDGRRRYVCDNVGGVHLSIAAESLDDLVINEAWSRFPDFTLAEVRDPMEQADLLAQIDTVDARLADWAREAAAAGLRAAEIAAGSAELRAERDRLEADLAEAIAAVPPPPLTFEEALPIVQAETRALLEAVIERIEIAPAKSMGARFDTGRIEIVWR
jgi:hypothetical protein